MDRNEIEGEVKISAHAELGGAIAAVQRGERLIRASDRQQVVAKTNAPSTVTEAVDATSVDDEYIIKIETKEAAVKGLAQVRANLKAHRAVNTPVPKTRLPRPNIRTHHYPGNR